MQGTVSWFNQRGGYGFIRTEDGKEVFVHRTAVKGKRLFSGDVVSYEMGERDGRPLAVEVEVLERAPKPETAHEVRADPEGATTGEQAGDSLEIAS